MPEVAVAAGAASPTTSGGISGDGGVAAHAADGHDASPEPAADPPAGAPLQNLAGAVQPVATLVGSPPSAAPPAPGTAAPTTQLAAAALAAAPKETPAAAQSAAPAAAQAAPAAAPHGELCSGLKPLLKVENIRVLALKNSSYLVTLALMSTADGIVATSIYGPVGVTLIDDVHNQPPQVSIDIPWADGFAAEGERARSAYEVGLKISREEPQTITFTSGQVKSVGGHLSVLAHFVLAKQDSGGRAVAKRAVLRCDDLPVI